MMAESFDDVFSDIDINKLPTLPQVLLIFLDATHAEVVSFDRLADVVKKDASLSARIVAAASSAYYGGQGKSLTFERVLVMLGLQTIKTIAITASVQQFFSRFDGASARRQKAFWRDSLTCAQLTKKLAKLTGYPYEDEAYLAGLIHNIGALIFSNNFPQQYASLVETAESEEKLIELETDAFGGSRFQAGAWIVDSWDVDPFMADAVLYQNEPVEALNGAHHLVKILAVACRLCLCNGSVEDESIQAAEKIFDLNHALISDLLEQSKSEVAEIASSMDIDLGSLEDETSANEISAEDEAKQVELAGKVRDIALLNGVRQDLSHTVDEKSVCEAIQKSLKILFNCQHSLFFGLSDDGSSLCGKALLGSETQVSEFEIALSVEGSLLTRCFNEKKVLHSLDSSAPAAPNVMDRQLIRLAGGEAMICLPLIVDQHALGVLAVGVSMRVAKAFERQSQLWRMFANEAAYALLVQRQQAQAQEDKGEEDGAFYRARAREIVHEVNNPLSIVKNYVHILGSKLDQSDVAQDELQIIKEELERAGQILLRLPGITDQRASSSGAALLDVNTLISDLLKIFRSSLFSTAGIEALTDLDEGMKQIVCDRNALKQILTNLIKNASEALDAGGRVTVETQAQVNFNGRNYVEIVVSDNGPGIPDHVQEKLFSPVQTTKGDEHAGLGLSIVKNLVDNLDGSISCRSSAKNGTRFEILIPRILE